MITKLALLIALQIASTPTVVPIQNASFEVSTVLPDTSTCGKSTWQNIPGWKFTQPSGSAYGVIAWTCEAPPDGKNVAFLAYGASMSQDLGIKPQAGIYTLKFWVANWFYSYFAGYTTTITEGTRAVCSTSGLATGDFTEITLVCPVSGYIANNDKGWSSPGNLVLSVSNSQEWPLLVDNFSLTFTPVN